jgi:hypothetical protein
VAPDELKPDAHDDDCARVGLEKCTGRMRINEMSARLIFMANFVAKRAASRI